MSIIRAHFILGTEIIFGIIALMTYSGNTKPFTAREKSKHVSEKSSPISALMSKLYPITKKLLESLQERKKMQFEHAEFLANAGVEQIDIPVLRARDRRITQYISRLYYDRGKAGILFHSHLDNGICSALFQGRASLKAISKPIQLNPYMEEFKAVCDEFGLKIV